jgi:hypothetical protein
MWRDRDVDADDDEEILGGAHAPTRAHRKELKVPLHVSIVFVVAVTIGRGCGGGCQAEDVLHGAEEEELGWFQWEATLSLPLDDGTSTFSLPLDHQLDQFHRVLIHQLLQHDHIYRWVARNMEVGFGGLTSNWLNLGYHHVN